MLCSAREMELGDDQSGIIELPAERRSARPPPRRSASTIR